MIKKKPFCAWALKEPPPETLLSLRVFGYISIFFDRKLILSFPLIKSIKIFVLPNE